MTDETRRKCIESGKLAMQDPELFQKCVDAAHRAAADPGWRKRCRPADESLEVAREKIRAYWSNPEARLAQSERKKKLYSNGRKVSPNGRTSPAEKWLRAKLEAEGCNVHTKGWPDFLVVYPDGRVKAIEVKSGSDFVKPDQAAVHEILRALGIEVEVVYVNLEQEREAA